MFLVSVHIATFLSAIRDRRVMSVIENLSGGGDDEGKGVYKLRSDSKRHDISGYSRRKNRRVLVLEIDCKPR